MKYFVLIFFLLTTSVFAHEGHQLPLNVTDPKPTAISGGVFDYKGSAHRLVDVDVPETYYAECAEGPDSEAARGWRANIRFQEILDEGVRIKPLESFDAHGRRWANVTINGQSVSDLLISEGFARPLSSPRRTWCHINPDMPHGTVP